MAWFTSRRLMTRPSLQPNRLLLSILCSPPILRLDLLKPVSGGSVVAGDRDEAVRRRVYAEAEMCDEAGHCVARRGRVRN